MTAQTTNWDAADYLDDRESIVAYLDAMLEEGDPVLIKRPDKFTKYLPNLNKFRRRFAVAIYQMKMKVSQI